METYEILRVILQYKMYVTKRGTCYFILFIFYMCVRVGG